MTQTRTETDTIGPIEVPAAAYWGAQTERSIENFPFATRERMPIEIVHALAFGRMRIQECINFDMPGRVQKVVRVSMQIGFGHRLTAVGGNGFEWGRVHVT